jgi:hypothetical protein
MEITRSLIIRTTIDLSLLEVPSRMSEIVGPALTNSWILGSILGVVYHFTCQYPRQLEIPKCFYTFAVANNVWFLVKKLLAGGVSRFWLEALIFNLAFVHPF